MALKKSQIYASLWQSCDELRGGMDASQYKDYILTLLFMKYVSDKYAAQPDALIDVPAGGGFDDMVKLKGDIEIGDKINKIIARFAEANDLKGVINQADFNDAEQTRCRQRDARSALQAGRHIRRISISVPTTPRATIYSATPTNTSCVTSPPSRARARDSFTPQPRSPASWRG